MAFKGDDIFFPAFLWSHLFFPSLSMSWKVSFGIDMSEAMIFRRIQTLSFRTFVLASNASNPPETVSPLAPSLSFKL